MTDELLELALPRLRRSLGLGAGEGDTDALTDALGWAEEAICRYLRQDGLPEYAGFLLVELAALGYRRRDFSGVTKSESYTEGQLSQSESYLTPAELAAGEQAILASLAPYRRVACRGNANETA